MQVGKDALPWSLILGYREESFKKCLANYDETTKVVLGYVVRGAMSYHPHSPDRIPYPLAALLYAFTCDWTSPQHTRQAIDKFWQENDITSTDRQWYIDREEYLMDCHEDLAKIRGGGDAFWRMERYRYVMYYQKCLFDRAARARWEAARTIQALYRGHRARKALMMVHTRPLE